MRISLIVAKSENNVIGRNNELPWHLKDDLQNFKKLTMGHHILMGRKTFESIGKVLPGRMSLVISNEPRANSENVFWFNSIFRAIKQAERNGETELFIITISNYSVRIIINYLEYLKLLNMPINIDIAASICTNISFNYFEKYTNYCKNEKNLSLATEMMYNLIDKGYSVMDILDNYFLFIKTTTILCEDEKYNIIKYICKYITIFYNIHDDEIELALFTNNIIKMFTNKIKYNIE